MTEWVRTFDLAVPAERVWAAFVDVPPERTWNGMLPAATLDAAARTLTWPDGDEELGVECSMRLEVTEVETGSRITLTRSGFGDGDLFEVRQTSKLVAWGEAFHDLAVYLASGVDLRRLFDQASATGVQFREEPGGMRVTEVRPDSFGALAGLERGDLVVRLAGAPVFDRDDMWLATRLIAPGTETSVQFLRGAELRESSGPMSSIDRWAAGELGGAPRDE
jgi:uncharacterized protein YndB with AHSA1/START domain